VGETALHAGVATKAHERAKLERLCHYTTRPAIATKRLSLTRNSLVRCELKTPCQTGTQGHSRCIKPKTAIWWSIFSPHHLVTMVSELMFKPFSPFLRVRATTFPLKRGFCLPIDDVAGPTVWRTDCLVRH